MPKPRLTHSAFVRSHGRPARDRGAWILSPTRRDTAFDGDLYGDMVERTGTLTEALAAAHAAQREVDTWAVMP